MGSDATLYPRTRWSIGSRRTPHHLGGCDSPDESSIESDESDEESDEEEAPSRAKLPAEQQKARLNKKKAAKAAAVASGNARFMMPRDGIRLINACAANKEAFLLRDGKVESRLSLEDGDPSP